MISINLIVPNSEEAFGFYKKAFGAELVLGYFDRPEGSMGASFLIGEDRFGLADSNPENGSRSPDEIGGTSFCIQLFVSDIEAALARALENGAKHGMPNTEQMPFAVTADGVMFGNVVDPYGFYWTISKEP